MSASPVAKYDEKLGGDVKRDDLSDYDDVKELKKAEEVRELPSLRLDTGDVRLKIREHAWQIWYATYTPFAFNPSLDGYLLPGALNMHRRLRRRRWMMLRYEPCLSKRMAWVLIHL